MSFTLTTQQECINKAGLNANAVVVASGTMLGNWCDEAEAILCAESNYDLVTNYGTLNAQGKKASSAFCSNYVATFIIDYSMANIGQREGETRLDVLENGMDKVLSIFKNNKAKAYLGIAES